MISFEFYILSSITLFATCVAVAYIIYAKKVNALQIQNLILEGELELQKAQQQHQEDALKLAQNALTEAFSSISSKALQQNTDAFLKLATENLKQHQQQATHTLNQKELAIENLVKPIKDALDKTEKQIHSIEKDRKEAYGALTQHLQFMSEAQKALQGETKNLVNALSRPEIRGQWGELTLKRLAELAGMVKHCDFFEQTSTDTDAGKIRPDMVVRMPGGRDIVVDVKTPLDAYLRAVGTDDTATRQQLLIKHAKNVKDRVRELASKAYWSQFDASPDFVVLFIPGDQFLSSALDIDPDLLEYAMQKKVVLATPNSFVALLRAIAYGWRQESLAENAEQIRQIGDELYHRLATFAEHLNKLGRSLSSSVQHYNKAAGSFDTRILTSARKFSEMGISAKKEVEAVEQIEHLPRSIETQKDTIKEVID